MSEVDPAREWLDLPWERQLEVAADMIGMAHGEFGKWLWIGEWEVHVRYDGLLAFYFDDELEGIVNPSRYFRARQLALGLTELAEIEPGDDGLPEFDDRGVQ